MQLTKGSSEITKLYLFSVYISAIFLFCTREEEKRANARPVQCISCHCKTHLADISNVVAISFSCQSEQSVLATASMRHAVLHMCEKCRWTPYMYIPIHTSYQPMCRTRRQLIIIQSG